jgi:hypothetical protein
MVSCNEVGKYPPAGVGAESLYRMPGARGGVVHAAGRRFDVCVSLIAGCAPDVSLERWSILAEVVPQASNAGPVRGTEPGGEAGRKVGHRAQVRGEAVLHPAVVFAPAGVRDRHGVFGAHDLECTG